MEKSRKLPSQNRSQLLFNSVIESAARVLPALGYARTTTNRIAVRAGVSIGSLYQYFPNKDAIIASVLERELNKHVDEVIAIVRANEKRPFPEVIELLTNKFYSLYLGQKAFSRELFNNVAKLEQVSQVLFVRNRVVEVLTNLLVERNHMDPELARKKVFIGLNAFMGVIQTCCLVSDLPMPEDEIKKQLSTMLQNYFE